MRELKMTSSFNLKPPCCLVMQKKYCRTSLPRSKIFDMKKMILAVAMALSFSVAGAQKCDAVKQGRFRITADDVNPDESILTRTAEHQFEDIKSKGLKL